MYNYTFVSQYHFSNIFSCTAETFRISPKRLHECMSDGDTIVSLNEHVINFHKLLFQSIAIHINVVSMYLL